MGLLTVLGLTARPSAGKAAATPAIQDPALPADGVDAGGSGAVDKNLAVFQAARAAVQKLVDDLAGHAQKAKITTQIALARQKLKDADDHAALKEWKQASASLAEVKPIVSAARKLADDWSDYAKRRATTMALILAFKTDAHSVDGAVALVRNTADAAANQTPPNFAVAIATLKSLDDKRKPNVDSLLTDVKTRLATVEKLNPKVKGYLDRALAEAKPLVEEAVKAAKDGDPALARQSATAALRVLGPAERRAGRRAEFDAQRPVAVKAVEAVRAAPAVAAQAKALDALVAQADALAAIETLKIEAGTQLLGEVKSKADAWAGLVKIVASVQAAQKTAGTGLAALDSHAAAARITPERDAIRKLLADSNAAAAGAAGAASPAVAWAAAQTGVQRAMADMAVARKLADGFGAAAGAEVAAGKPADLAGMKAALDKLRADGKVAAKAAQAAAASAEFKTFDTQVAAADKALAAKDGKAAAPALASAAKALIAAKTIQAEHGQFVIDLASAEAQLKKLNASPRAALIKARIDPVEQHVAAAQAADKAAKGGEAIAALRLGVDAVAAALAADKARAEYDALAATVGKRVASDAKDAATKAALQKKVADATKIADQLRFDEAKRAVGAVDIELDQAKLQGLLGAASPKADKITELSKTMADKGGASTVDAMIQNVPNGGNADLIAAMASGRYGVKFTSKPSALHGADPAAAMKICCKMWQTIPQDIVNNKSVSSVAFEDLQGGISAGHSYATAAVTMKGRVEAADQQFGSKLTEPDPVTGADVNQLPAVEEKCKPKDETHVDFLNFAAAHEVGHGVDEERGFMKKNGKGAEYGGWVTFGGNLQPLADTIGSTAAFAEFYKTAEQKRYILDKLQSRDPQAPAAAPGSPAANAKRAFDTWHAMATSANVFRRQSDSESLKLRDNKIYHEAYARVWVGYDADARKRGLTGYQFRAPGDWFAELYAGHRAGKLRADHPAMSWLTKL